MIKQLKALVKEPRLSPNKPSKKVAFVFALVFAVIGSIYLLQSRATTSMPIFESSGLSGGGYVNVLAISPHNGTIVTGGDIFGINRSQDNGLNYQTANQGLSAAGYKVSSLLYHPSTSGTVYAAVGDKGNTGGIFKSTDDGTTWSLLSGVPKFSGNHTGGPNNTPDNHPRPVGQLLAIHPSSNTMWAATFDQGLMRSTNGGSTWTAVGLTPATKPFYLRSLAYDATTDTLYVSAYGEGIYKLANARTATAPARLTNSPTFTEELKLLGGKIYAAAGKDGIRVSSDKGASWVNFNNGLVINGNSLFTAIDGVSTANGPILYAGKMNENPSQSSTDSVSVYKSVNGGNWTSVTGSNIDNRILGTDQPWWFEDAFSGAFLGRKAQVVGQIAIHPSQPNTVFVSGRGGLWRSTDAGGNWRPSINGLGATSNSTVLADPNSPSRVYVTNTDFVFLQSGDAMKNVKMNRPPSGATCGSSAGGQMGLDLAIDSSTTPSTVYVAHGRRDCNNGGKIHSSADPLTKGWVDEDLDLSGATNGGRPLGIAVSRVNNTRVLLAGVEGSGIWRKAGTGGWQKVNSGAFVGSYGSPVGARRAHFWWAPGSSTVYLADPATGIWRSNDNGQAWTKIWNKPFDSGVSRSGFIVTAAGDAGRVFVSIPKQGVYRLENATQGTVGNGIATPQKVGSTTNPGPLTVDASGKLWVAQIQAGAAETKLERSTDGGVSWQDITLTSSTTAEKDSATVYKGSAVDPSGISVASDGTVYLSTAGNGVIVGKPSSTSTTSVDTKPPSLTGLSPASGATVNGIVTVSVNASDDVEVKKVNLKVDGVFEQIDTTAPYEFMWDSTQVSNGTHTIEVKAFDAADNQGTASATYTVNNTIDEPPAIPTNLMANPGDKEVTLSWSSNTESDLTGYAVRYRLAGGTWTTDSALGKSMTSYTVTNLTNDQTYEFQIQAVDAGGNSSVWSSSVGAIPKVAADTESPITAIVEPTLNATVNNMVTVKATATDNVEVKKVNLKVDGVFEQIDTTAPYEFMWDSTQVSNGTHTIEVKAFDAADNQGTSAQVTVTVNNSDTVAPSTPTNLASVTPTYNQVDLSWVASTDNSGGSGLAKYAIYRNASSGMQLLAYSTTTTYSDTTVSENTNYTYYVVAIDVAGNTSEPSNTITTSTPAAPDTTKPTAPVNLVATPNEGAIGLSWNASTDNTGVAKYYVYRSENTTAAGIIAITTTTSYTDNAAETNIDYTYYIRAVDAANNLSSPSNSVTSSLVVIEQSSTPTDTISPTTPAELAAEVVNPHQVNLSWQVSTDNIKVAHYDIYRNGHRVRSVTSTSYADGTTDPNTDYTYYVVAVDSSDNTSPNSNITTLITNKGKNK